MNEKNFDRNKKKRGLFAGLTAITSVIAAAAVVAAAMAANASEKPPVTADAGNGANISAMLDKYAGLPKITFADYGVRAGGLRNIPKWYAPLSMKNSELLAHSPWNENAKLETMPVYSSSSAKPDLEKMRGYVKKAAAALGISESELEIGDNTANFIEQLEMIRESGEQSGAPKEEIESEIERISGQMFSQTSVYGKANGVNLTLYSDYTMKVEFDTPIQLPEGCRLGADAAESEDLAAVEYLADRFKDLLGYEKPEIAQSGNFDEYNFAVWDASGGLDEQIVNYSTKQTEFIGDFDDNTKMSFMWIYSNEGCEKIGDYPILTAAQAEEILKSDRYSGEERMPADAEILKIDMDYVNISGFTAVIPCYNFYVKTDETPDNGCDLACDVYTVYAVPEEFIEVQEFRAIRK